MNRISEETIFMANNKIETYENLMTFKNYNSEELNKLMSQRENLWKKYRRAKTEDIKVNIYNEISKFQPRIKELQKNNRYCDNIEERSNTIQTNIIELNNLSIDKETVKVR